MSDYIWVVKNPLGTDVALKKSTYESHIQDETTRTEAGIKHLTLVADAVKSTIIYPRFIYYDKDYDQNLRHRYIDLVAVEELLHIQALVVVVDTDRDPHEIVTWMIKRDLKKELLSGRGVIYDSRKNQE